MTTWSEEMGDAFVTLYNAYRRHRYANDPAYRERRLKVTPEQRKRQAELRRHRFHSDPDYRAKRNAQSHTGRRSTTGAAEGNASAVVERSAFVCGMAGEVL